MFEHLFGDDLITATDLNRKPGKVLDRAASRPITITRNDEAFALLSRAVAQRMFHRYQDTLRTAEVMQAVLKCRLKRMAPDEKLGWLLAFDEEEHMEFLDELLHALDTSRNIQDQESYEEVCVETVIHEWHESALAILSTVHKGAFEDRSKGASVPITNPHDVLPES